MIAVCLLTCGRVTMTARTASAFLEHNRGRKDMTLLHCEGLPFADQDAYHARCIAKAHGFLTIDAPSDRVSQMHSLRAFMGVVAFIGAEFVLWLENDWISVAPIPPLEFFQETRDAGIVTWRMFGKHKMQGYGPRAMAGTHQIGTNKVIKWRRFLPFRGWQFGEAHWAGGGSVVHADHLRRHLGLARLKDVITADHQIPSLRPTLNIMFSIGHETTPGFMG